MLFDQMHHVAIIVSGYQKAKEFYVEKLGFPVLRENFRPDKGDWKLDLRLRHLAFRVDDVEQAVQELEAQGIECEPVRLDPYSQRRFTFFHDPDGLPLELHE